MRKFIPLLVVLGLVGCTVPVGPLANGVNPFSSKALQPPEPLGGLTFSALTTANAHYAGGAGVPMPAAVSTGVTSSASFGTGTRAPEPGGTNYAPPAQPSGLTSGNMNGGYYGFGPSFGGGAPTALVSLTQAETAGSAGPYLQMLKLTVLPVLKDWTTDAQLVASNGSIGPDGLLLPASPSPSATPAGGCVSTYYGGPNEDTSWRLSYFSAMRNEMLNFTVTHDKTTIVRTRWVPLDLASVAVTVDDDVALRALSAAIKTPGFKGEEEKTGLDYFLGTAFSQPCYGGMPTPAASGGSQNPTQVVYDVPADARWNANLQLNLGKPVWELNFYAPNNKPTSDQDHFYVNNSASGLVDARTGAVIRFSRPSKQYFNQPVPGPSLPPDQSKPTPSPVGPGPVMTPIPSAAPSGPPPSVAPSPTPSVLASAKV